jgi:negative regulator of flagellin synthesis FlgM
MKIWGDIPKISGVYDSQKNFGKVDKASGVASKKDVVSISNQAKDFQTALRSLKDLPDVRNEKVNELAERYKSGSYDVSGKNIADKIINSTFDKKA